MDHEPRYQLLPSLRKTREKDSFTVENPTHHTNPMGLSRDYGLVLDFFRRPRTMREFETRFGHGGEVLRPLLDGAIIGPVTSDGVVPQGLVAARTSLEREAQRMATKAGVRPRRRFPRFTDRLSLGRRGLKVSPYILGITDRESKVEAAFEAGINFFFLTADVHWPAYEPLRRGLRKLLRSRPSVRDEIVVAVPSYAKGPVGLNEVMEAVPELGRIDVVVMGAVETYDYSHRLPIFTALRDHRHYGAKAVGASFHDRPTARKSVDAREVDIAFARYSVARQGARDDLFDSLEPHPGTLLYGFKARSGYVSPSSFEQLRLGRDAWLPSVEDHYRFALTRPQFDGLLFSAVGKRMDALHAATLAKPLTEAEEQYMTHLFALARWSVCPEFGGYQGG